jgi:hypothetical protein
MKIQNQVCSLGQAQKLKQLGISQHDAHFMWFEVSNGDDEGDFEKDGVEWHPILTQQDYNRGEHRAIGVIDSDLTTSEGEFCSYKPNECKAFTVAELGEMLIIDDDDNFIDSSYNEHGGTWDCHLRRRNEECESGFAMIHSEEAETEAEVRAEMLIWLLENKIQTPENIRD